MADITLPTRQSMEEKYGASPVNTQAGTPAKIPVKPIDISKPVIRKKRSLGQRFADAFLGDNITDVKQYIIAVAVVPTLKRLICDIPQLLFFRSVGGYYGQPGSYNLGANPNQMPYNRISTSTTPSTNIYGKPSQQTQNYMFDDIILSSFAEAEALRGQMLDRIEMFGAVSVAEVNEMLKAPVNPTDWNWGWKSLATADIRQVRGGFMIMLPRCTYLK